MRKISANLPNELFESVDRAARNLDRSRSQIFRHALEYYLAGLDDETSAALAVPDPSILMLDWDEVKHSLLAAD